MHHQNSEFLALIGISNEDIVETWELLEDAYSFEEHAPGTIYDPEDLGVAILPEFWPDFDESQRVELLDRLKNAPDQEDRDHLEIPFTLETIELLQAEARRFFIRLLFTESPATRGLLAWEAKRVNAECKYSGSRKPRNFRWTYWIYAVLVVMLIASLAGASDLQDFVTTITAFGFWTALVGGSLALFIRKKMREDAQTAHDLDNAKKEHAYADRQINAFHSSNKWYLAAISEYLADVNALVEKSIATWQSDLLSVDLRELRRFKMHTDQGQRLPTTSPAPMRSFDSRAYEELCASWMSILGHESVSLTADGADGGLDIISRDAVCQVKLHGKPVTVQPVRELFGAAMRLNRVPVFFASSGYTTSAVDFANETGVVLLVADPVSNTLAGVTPDSKAFLQLER